MQGGNNNHKTGATKTGARVHASRKPALATMPTNDPVWNRYVDDYLPANGGTFKDYVALFKLARGRQILILNGSVGRRQRYRDLVFAILLNCTRHPPPVLIQDATWEPGSEALAQEFPLLKRWLPRLARLAISALDGPHVRYAVLSTDEVRTFGQVWGVDPERVVFQPFPHTLGTYEGMATTDEGYVFAGGNSMRDYGLLGQALVGTDIPLRAAARWNVPAALVNVQASSTSHDTFMRMMAHSHAVVVPMRRCVRSAGQSTYLNGMALHKPVIVTEAPGVHDYIRHGETGIIVPHDAQQLRAALQHVMDPANADFYRAMGERAQAEVLSRFTEITFRHGLLRHAGLIGEEASLEKATAPAPEMQPQSSSGAPLYATPR